MSMSRPIAISIAGFDPSAGAGILADIKTFEQNGVYGFGVCSALTRQNDREFIGVDWLAYEQIVEQLLPLVNKFEISAVKVGIVKSLYVLNKLILYIKSHCKLAKIVIDPVLKASAGFSFHEQFDPEQLKSVLRECDVITPNYEEIQFLRQVLGDEPFHYGNVLLKGGHHPDKKGIDTLYLDTSPTDIPAINQAIFAKHGSGCVLSSAIASNLAKGKNLVDSCKEAKAYTETFLSSNSSLLGYHNL
jgi:hydroxymethylpyrimidine/phosphomethylpyrimidine kinase